MSNITYSVDQLDARRREQTPQALARLAIVGLFISLWFLLWIARIPMPVPFLLVLFAEAFFFIVYWRTVMALRSVRAIAWAHSSMLAVEILMHTAMVYFLGTVSWLAAFAYVFGLIFSNTFLDLRRGFLYTAGASASFIALIVLEATGVVPHYVYLEQGALRYTDTQFVVTTAIGAAGVFFSIYVWVNWVGHQLRQERDSAVRTQDELLDARLELLRANEQLEERVKLRTAELEWANAAFRASEERLRNVATNSPVVLFSLDTNGIFTLSEGKGLSALGLRPGEIVGQSVFEVYRAYPDLLSAVRRALAGEEFTEAAHIADLVFETHFAPVRDDEGTLTGIIGVATDITERTQAEDALRESETQFRGLAETISAAVFIFQGEKMLYVNSAAESLTGYAREAILKMNFWDVIHPEDRELVKERGTARQRGEDVPASYEVKILRNDGQARWVEFTAGTIEIDGQLAVLGTGFDITERIQAAEALERLQRKNDLLLVSAGEGIYGLDLDGATTFVNPVAAKLLGWEIAEIIGKPQHALIHHAHADGQPYPREVCPIYAAFRDGTVHHVTDEVFWRKDGSSFPVEYRSTPIRDEHGEIVGAVVTFQDITERKQAEEALRLSEEKYRTIFDNVQDIFYQTDAAGKIIEINPAVERYGYTRSELIGASVLDIYEDPERRSAFVQAILESGAVSDYEMRLRRKDGPSVDMSVSARAVMNPDGTLSGFEGSIRDITERKQAEDALRRQAQLDPLTNLLNRRAGLASIEERLVRAKGTGVEFALFVLDVDRFKSVNDNHSHETGDAALIRLANILSSMTGDRGVVCRLGGDEFEIGIDAMGLEEAQVFGEELQASLQQALDSAHPQQLPQFTFSIGIACFSDDGDSLLMLSRRADRAMYAAKAAGGNAIRAWRQIDAQQAA